MITLPICTVLAFLTIALYEAVVKLWLRIRYYESQGVTILPGSRNPIFGSIQMFYDYMRALKSNDGPLESVFTWDINQKLG